jgi:hypothetical protein
VVSFLLCDGVPSLRHEICSHVWGAPPNPEEGGPEKLGGAGGGNRAGAGGGMGGHGAGGCVDGDRLEVCGAGAPEGCGAGDWVYEGGPGAALMKGAGGLLGGGPRGLWGRGLRGLRGRGLRRGGRAGGLWVEQSCCLIGLPACTPSVDQFCVPVQ